MTARVPAGHPAGQAPPGIFPASGFPKAPPSLSRLASDVPQAPSIRDPSVMSKTIDARSAKHARQAVGTLQNQYPPEQAALTRPA